MSLEMVKTARFRRDFKRCMKQGRNMPELVRIMRLLEAGENLTLYPEYNDHPLHGEYADTRECHIAGRNSDWLLIYSREPDAVIFYRCGSHADLFE